MAVGTDDGEVPESMRRPRNVWDRLGKPAMEDQGLATEADRGLEDLQTAEDLEDLRLSWCSDHVIRFVC